MNQIVELFSLKYVDTLLKNLSFYIEKTDVIFHRESDLTQQVIVYDSTRNIWIFRESYIYTGGEQEVNKNFETLSELIKKTIIPYFYQIPDNHVRSMFTLWAKDWAFTIDETEELIKLKFVRNNEYFFYRLMIKEKYNSYVKVHKYSSVDLFDKYCSKDGVHCSKNILLKDLLENNYK